MIGLSLFCQLNKLNKNNRSSSSTSSKQEQHIFIYMLLLSKSRVYHIDSSVHYIIIPRSHICNIEEYETHTLVYLYTVHTHPPTLSIE